MYKYYYSIGSEEGQIDPLPFCGSSHLQISRKKDLDLRAELLPLTWAHTRPETPSGPGALEIPWSLFATFWILTAVTSNSSTPCVGRNNFLFEREKSSRPCLRH